MRVVLVDSRDSFVHNLAQALGVLGARVELVQSDAVTPDALLEDPPDRLVLGPGPGRPEAAGCLIALARATIGELPVLGVCLGHQAIAAALGGRVVRHTRVVHGLAEPIHHDGCGLFAGVPPGAPMTRYHSLVVDPTTLPAALEVCAWSDDGAIMAVRHRSLPVHGVQFHPESVLSGEPGLRLLGSFLHPRSVARAGSGRADRGSGPRSAGTMVDPACSSPRRRTPIRAP